MEQESMNHDIKRIKNKIKKLNLFPKKKLGQHFLINPQIIQNIISKVEDLNPSMLVEIGPGWGALTEHLITLEKPFYVVEADPTLAQYWRDQKAVVMEGSALKIPWQKGIKEGALLVSNLPYNIGGRLLIQLCPGPAQLKTMILMFQKEVGQRILAPHSCKSYGVLSVLAQCFWETTLLLSVRADDFYPRPKVAGQVLIFINKSADVPHPKKFLSFVKFCFSCRRKMLFKQLCQWTKEKKGDVSSQNQNLPWWQNLPPSLKKPHIQEIFNQMNITPFMRAEELSPSQFVILFNALQKKGFF